IEASKLFENVNLFGKEVAQAFLSTETAFEIEESGSCYALGRFTACVFHLMRVLERGLLALANNLNIAFTIPFEYQQWHTIIERIESEIHALQKLPSGKHKTDTLKLYSEAA